MKLRFEIIKDNKVIDSFDSMTYKKAIKKIGNQHIGSLLKYTNRKGANIVKTIK